MSATPAGPGWYDDPDDPGQLRYFDGVVWTSHTTPRRSPTADSSVIGRGPADQGAPGAPLQGGWVHPGASQQPGQPGQQGQWPGQQGQQGQQGQWPGQQGQWQGGMPPAGGYGGGYGPAYAQRKDVLPDGAVLAEWWRRLVARILDSIITSIVALVLAIPWLGDLFTAISDFVSDTVNAAESGGTPPDQGAFTSEVLAATLPITIISIVVSLLYETTFLTLRGATPGKMVLGTVVRRVGGAGPLTVVDALKRQVIGVATSVLGLLPVVSIVGSLLSILDPAWLLWDPKRQTLHDKVADTVVVIKGRSG